MFHRSFVADTVLGGDAPNESLRDVIAPLCEQVRGGGGATVLLFGQTGTGKTHSFLAILELLAGGPDALLAGLELDVSFVELHGSQCRDLLDPAKGPVKLREDEHGVVHLRGAKRAAFSAGSFAEVQARLAEALALRTSRATERNPLSSRSHAVLTVHLPGALLRVVDLAGSERNYETTAMSAAEHKAFATNSQSLMALRSCFRALAAGAARVPYRSSQLTHLLRTSFQAGHTTTVVATVSPAASDAIHTQHTLESVMQLCPRLEEEAAELCVDLPLELPPSAKPVALWSSTELAAWLGVVEDGRFAKLVLPPGITGRDAVQLKSLADAFEGGMRAARDTAEGASWNEAAAASIGNKRIMRRLFAALAREEKLRGDGGIPQAGPPLHPLLG